MWCVNPMVVNTWNAGPYAGFEGGQEELAGGEQSDTLTDPIPKLAPTSLTSSISRSASFNRINLALPNRRPRRSLSTSGSTRQSRPHVSPARPRQKAGKGREEELKKERGKRNSFSDSVLTRLARQYSFTRSRRTGSSSSDMSSSQTAAAAPNKIKTPRRRRNKDASKNEDNSAPGGGNKLKVPKPKRIPSPLRMIHGHANGDFHSSPDSASRSPPHFERVFPSPPASPSRITNSAPVVSVPIPQRTLSPAPADDSPLPSPPPDDKAYDSGRMSMSSFRSFGSGRPTSLSSVTSSISSRTSRGSDYFSSASSTGQADQITSYRLGLQTVLPDLDESDSADRADCTPEKGAPNAENGFSNDKETRGLSKNTLLDNGPETTRASAFNHKSKDLNDVDHLAPVANLAMLSSPHLSYVDRVILELLETERMYVRSLRDILTGYLSVIRSTPDLGIHPDDVKDLFGNIRDIYDFNRTLLRELEDCYGDPKKVAECFVTKDEDFRVYTEYCTNYPSSVAAMTRCMRNPNLVDFFKVQQDDLRHTLPLGSYLLKPVQRVLKYHLLLQELVKHCDKEGEECAIIRTALQTMTRVARHINEMKRRHEDAVHIQEIQSLLTNWQGNELATYGELILESEMKMQGAKNERQVFLFEMMILITKRREDGYLVCKANIMCANLVLLESVPNIPLGFQIQPYAENIACINPPSAKQANGVMPSEQRLQRYTLLAPTAEEKNTWTYHIKRLIIETMRAAVPAKAKKSIMRMKASRDGDSGDSEEERAPVKAKPRYGSGAVVTSQDAKTNKSPLARFGSRESSSSNLLGGSAGNAASKKATPPALNLVPKARKRADSTSKKSLHKRALRRKDEVESSDDISSDSVPTTPSGLKAGKFTFPGIRANARTGNTPQQAGSKPSVSKQVSDSKALAKNEEQRSKEATKTNQKNQNQKNGSKPHHQSVIYRRHKRRTSQPITITEKRLSMKLPDDESAEKDAKGDGEANDEEIDELLNFNPLARESVSWDIQIVEAVFERYKKESPQAATKEDDEHEDYDTASLGSTYLTVPSDVAPSPLLSLDHTPILSQRRKSRIVVVPSSDTSDDGVAKQTTQLSAASVIRRKKDRNKNVYGRTSGVVYTLPPQEDEAESDSGVSDAKALIRKAAQVSDNLRHSKVIHESDTDLETSLVLKEKAVVARRKSSLRRRERNQRKKANSGTNSLKSSCESLSKSGERDDSEERSNIDKEQSNDIGVEATKNRYPPDATKAIISSVQSMSTQTISRADSNAFASTSMVSVQSTSFVSTTSTGRHGDDLRPPANDNNNNSKRNDFSTQGRRTRQPAVNKDIQDIPTGKVRGLIERLKKSTAGENEQNAAPLSPRRRPGVASPTSPKGNSQFSYNCTFGPKSLGNTTSVSSGIATSPTARVKNTTGLGFNHNNNNNATTTSESTKMPVKVGKTQTTQIKPSGPQPTVHNGLKIPVLTTESLPLTLTSSSESETDSDPTIAQRVKRLSRGDFDNASGKPEDTSPQVTEPKNLPSLFLRRTFSQEDRSNTRHSRNLLLEARMSGEFAEESAMCFRGVEDDVSGDVRAKTPSKLASDESNEVKHYLFEKLCLETPKESNFIDKMSEEFEHLCSDMEGTLHHSGHESHAFSTSEDDATLSGSSSFSPRPFMMDPIMREVCHQVAKQTNKPAQPEKKVDVTSEQPKIIKPVTQPENTGRRIPTKHQRDLLPNRSDSICSTRSEKSNPPARGCAEGTDDAARGRQTSLRGRNSFCSRLPAKDMQVIPQRNVMKLMKQFSELTKDSEKVHRPPRRSKSVGGGPRNKSRWRYERSTDEPKSPDQTTNDGAPPDARDRPSVIRSVSTKSIQLTPTKRVEVRRRDRRIASYSAGKIDTQIPPDREQSTERVAGVDLQIASTAKDHDGDGEDDVFSTQTTTTSGANSRKVKVDSMTSDTDNNKKMSFVEMFAASTQKEEDSETTSTDNTKSVTKAPGVQRTALPGIGSYSPSVKVYLVHDAKGPGSLEPRVLNLSGGSEDDVSRREEVTSPTEPEKRHSWANRLGNNTELSVRTRLGSSSFTRSKRRGMLMAESAGER